MSHYDNSYMFSFDEDDEGGYIVAVCPLCECEFLVSRDGYSDGELCGDCEPVAQPLVKKEV